MPLKPVFLSVEELYLANETAMAESLRKVQYNRNTGYRSQTGRPMHEIIADAIKGYLGEIAACKTLGLSWKPGGKLVSTGDIAGTFEVRCTHHRSGHLLIYPKDNGEIMLVIGDWPKFQLIGFLHSSVGQQKKYWKTANPSCFWVPWREIILF